MRQKPTEERIRDYLRKNQQATCQELALVLGLTKANIQYHLQKLTKEKILAVRDIRPAVTRGRPEKIYRLHPDAREDNFDLLCEALLGAARRGEDGASATLSRAGEILADKAGCSGPLNQRLSQLVRFLNQHGYMANWEAHQSGPRVTFKNCPYAAALANHPELCEVDAQMLMKALTSQIEQVERMQFRDEKRPNVCRFLIKSTKE